MTHIPLRYPSNYASLEWQMRFVHRYSNSSCLEMQVAVAHVIIIVRLSHTQQWQCQATGNTYKEFLKIMEYLQGNLSLNNNINYSCSAIIWLVYHSWSAVSRMGWCMMCVEPCSQWTNLWRIPLSRLKESLSIEKTPLIMSLWWRCGMWRICVNKCDIYFLFYCNLFDFFYCLYNQRPSTL